MAGAVRMTRDCSDCRHGVSDIDPSTGEFDFACPYMDVCGTWKEGVGYTFPRWAPIKEGWM